MKSIGRLPVPEDVAKMYKLHRCNRKEHGMSRIEKVISVSGFLLFCIGASCIDSPNMLPPVLITISGLAIMAYAGKEYIEHEKEE